ncbi:hypothetical protein MKW98_002430 [Papaver atlanticum]|uniref:Protein-L-isoaspartate O-methyltransferase n=1 Tax=Papaver atlanticum TaxID=357466 RepID=A0AAD4SA62_9MAGN|nr:hypothetical protein MKW98_002430 [Papaver atlanticum]
MGKNEAMVVRLQKNGIISSKKVAEVMESIDRGLFVPDGIQSYVDTPLAIGYNATISAPHMHAACLQLLLENLQPGMHALDDLDLDLVGSQGHAIGIEHIPELASTSLENIKNSAAALFLEEGSLSIHVGDGRLGWPEFALYDAIHVGAAAPEIPQALIQQLKPGGRLVIPVGVGVQNLQVVDKKMDGSVTVRNELADQKDKVA